VLIWELGIKRKTIHLHPKEDGDELFDMIKDGMSLPKAKKG
jgi:hypothetical protein